MSQNNTETQTDAQTQTQTQPNTEKQSQNSANAGQKAIQKEPDAPRDESDTSFVQNITSKEGLLSALSATLLVLAVPVLVYLGATGAVTLASVSGMWAWVFASIFGMAAIRLFGKDALSAIQKARGK